MPIPRIAIVGRPNAGKSSLLNMIAGAKVSIVDPTPGVTRDRVAAIVDLEHPEGPGAGPFKPVEIIDTGGFGVYTAEGARYDEVGADLATLTGDIESQIAAAVESADIVLFAVDAQTGISPHDREIATLLREGRLGPAAIRSQGRRPSRGEARGARGAKVRVVATKVDGPKWEPHGQELAGLGFGEPFMCSAKNNYMRRELIDALYELLPRPKDQVPAHADLCLAIIGKRNSGKSTLVNTLAGEPRMIVSEIAGTTRDAVDVRFELDGRAVVAIDTAGLRRKKSFQNMVEWYALDRSERAIARADVVLLLLDAGEKLSQVDEQLAMMCQKSFKPVVIVVNKWDDEETGVLGKVGRKGRPVTTEDYEDYVRDELKGLSFAPISFMSAKRGLNVRETIDLAFELRDQAGARVGTGKLNRLVRVMLEQRAPSDKHGTQAKVYYVAQTAVHPPTITLVVNNPDMFTLNYQRYLLNRFREELPFAEVPIRLQIRPRKAGAPKGEAPIAQAGVVTPGVRKRRSRSGRLSGAEPPNPLNPPDPSSSPGASKASSRRRGKDPGEFVEDAAAYFEDE